MPHRSEIARSAPLAAPQIPLPVPHVPPPKAVEIFIKRIQDWCVEYLIANYFTTIEDVETNADEFKKGVLHQIDYVRRNGELSIEATNIIRVMSPNAKNVFMNIGLCNTRQERYYGYRR